MLYAVGSKIDLREIQPETDEPVHESYDQYMPGTKISFLKMVQGMTILNVNEPPLSLRVAMTN